ncbi:unnamed protein product [Macrosiphum euphorbiae]|uniref:Helitron helicase-like domain-containing protein n=2 Tax=Macrosiphum euphorbiae TaxID=13131 RepID=A0AAV0Y8H2_9HEMI|nr:unnamed protein product [Macrosiphum euphorbiae]
MPKRKQNIGKNSLLNKRQKKLKKTHQVEDDIIEETKKSSSNQKQMSQRTERRKSKMKKNLEMKAFNYDCSDVFNNDHRISIGLMDIECKFCKALKFQDEFDNMCCGKGKVNLPDLTIPEEPLSTYLSGTTIESKHFLSNIRKYNSCFNMTSFGANRKKESGFQTTFKIQGQIYHRIGSLLPYDCESSFLQIYFIGDDDIQSQRRCSIVPNVQHEIVQSLQNFLNEHNALIKLFKTSLDNMPSDECQIVLRADKIPSSEHERRFNLPVVNEVAAIINGNEFSKRDIVLQKRSNEYVTVQETHKSYDALQYPLMFWMGEDGYHFEIYEINPVTGLSTKKRVSSMKFYAYRMMIRTNPENHLLHYKQLLNQFIVYMYAKIENERLRYIRCNQKALKVEQYINLKDAFENDENVSDIGQKCILPASFIGSPRHMHEYIQDALCYVRHNGKPCLFITFTCNIRWTEITNLLLADQQPSDRHDLIARVFKLKLRKLIDLITKCKIFGNVISWVYSIEWQKRGLPHDHILIWLENKVHPDRIDNIISVELKDPEKDPHLFDIIKKNMIHGPCGQLNPFSVCMKDGQCKCNYPRKLLDVTRSDKNGYPLYRRRSITNGGFQTAINDYLLPK